MPAPYQPGLQLGPALRRVVIPSSAMLTSALLLRLAQVEQLQAGFELEVGCSGWCGRPG